ncbi:transposase [Endozoicomonas sp. SCSIO W0465]|uniref:transposase n=1 Tax=Endozoicomonas sp. SCSIO W0465 TaxID=2918516 RepID=UPI00211384BF|nr:transposase [Endozoicomonas sp. SCSIO W0465]
MLANIVEKWCLRGWYKNQKIPDLCGGAEQLQTLFRFRAGIEAGISWLKRCFGLSRCHCKGSERFDSHCWLSVVCYNLVILARHPAPS